MERLMLINQGAGATLAATGGDAANAIALSIVGMGIVFASLALLALILMAMGRLLPEVEAPAAQTPARQAARGATKLDGDLDTHTLAIIAAAAAVAVGGEVRVRSVQAVKDQRESR